MISRIDDSGEASQFVARSNLRTDCCWAFFVYRLACINPIVKIDQMNGILVYKHAANRAAVDFFLTIFFHEGSVLECNSGARSPSIFIVTLP